MTATATTIIATAIIIGIVLLAAACAVTFATGMSNRWGDE